MKKLLARFNRDRRGAIAMMFAASLFPLVGMVALSIDYSFYAEARSQFALAGDAATFYSIREATATYVLDLKAGQSNAVASANAVAAGNAAGALWFNSQLATLPTATPTAATPTVNVTANGGNGAAGFTSAVGYVGLYPPFFDPLFKQNSIWHIAGTSTATSQYQYVELLMMLDTSGSMLVSADPLGVQTMDENTVCIPTPELATNTGTDIGSYVDPAIYNQTAIAAGETGSALYGGSSTFVIWNTGNSNVALNQPIYVKQGTSLTNASCPTTKYTSGSYKNQYLYNNWNGLDAHNYVKAEAPCAFACHNQTSTWSSTDGTGYTYVNGVLTRPTAASEQGALGTPLVYTQDLYGLSRYLGVQLKTDVVFSSAEAALNTMNSSEQVANQFTVGIYQFNDDVCPIVRGGAGDALAEATASLTGASGNATTPVTGASSALAALDAIDYTQTPSETYFPAISDSNEDNINSDLPLAVYDLVNGKTGNTGTGGSGGSGGSCVGYSSSTATAPNPIMAPLATPPSPNPNVGDTAADPEKDFFLITDGMGDIRSPNSCGGGGTLAGEMTSASAEAKALPTQPPSSATSCDGAVCAQLKKLGFTVYVLDILYPDTQVAFYMNPNPNNTPYTADDYPSEKESSGGTPQRWNTGYNTSGAQLENPPPNTYALQQCATNNSDFFLATSSTAIASAMKDMLQSALSSSVRITN